LAHGKVPFFCGILRGNPWENELSLICMEKDAVVRYLVEVVVELVQLAITMMVVHVERQM
jgi:hypothetical protein